VANGTLPASARDEALADLVARAESDLAPEVTPVVSSPKRSWIAAIVAGIALPLVAFGVYLALGTPAATDPKTFAPVNHAATDPQIVAMVETLAAKMKERPDDPRGWSLLARSLGALGRFKESADAYEHLNRLVPNDAQVLADYADALGMAQGRSLEGKPYELAKAALQVDPRHHKALALAGTAALDANDLPAAMGYWQTLAADLPAGSPDEAQVKSVLEEIRERATKAGVKLPAQAPAAKTAIASAPGGTVSGSVSVSPSIASKVSAGDTLFIFARAEGGGRAPIAVVRRSAAELPLSFTLDDSSAMSPQNKLSMAQAVHIEARLSKSGTAIAQPGDLLGRSGVVKPGARDVKIVIDQVVP
jgi:cytochrome c-type biogenesis protein CcmH